MCDSNADDSIPARYSNYQSHIAPRSTLVRRHTILSSGSSNNNNNKNNNAFGGGADGFVSLKQENPTCNVTSIENRENVKRDLITLNDKFASYIERVRYLEVHNKKIQMEVDGLKKRAAAGSGKIREMYETELNEAKHLIQEIDKDNENAEFKAEQCVNDVEKFRKRYNHLLDSRNASKECIDALNKQIATNKAEINLLRRRLGDLNDEQKFYKLNTQRVLAEIKRVKDDLQTETLQCVQIENEKIGLEKELCLLKQRHNQELEELKENTFLDSGLDSSQFFKSELANAIREIRDTYETFNNNQRVECEQWYNRKIQELQTRNRPEETDAVREETRRLHSAVSDQRRENANIKIHNAELDARIKCLKELLSSEKKNGKTMISKKDHEKCELERRQEDLSLNYEELTQIKSTLEEEINTYRRLLEGDDSTDGLKQVIDNAKTTNA